jgi:hypothetical protein
LAVERRKQGVDIPAGGLKSDIAMLIEFFALFPV